MLLPGVVWCCEQDDDVGFDLRGQGQGRKTNLVNFERRQRIAGIWIENVASGGMQCRPWIWPRRSRSAARYGQDLAYSMNCTSMTKEGRIRRTISLRTWCWHWIWCQRWRSGSAARYGEYLAYSKNYTSMTREGRIRGKVSLRTWRRPWIWCQR